METRSSGSTAARRLRGLLALAADYVRYLVMKRGRLLRRTVRRAVALLSYHDKGKRHLGPSRLALEYEFSCSDSPGHGSFCAATRPGRLHLRAAAAASCFGLGGAYGSPEKNEGKAEEEEEEGWAGDLDVDDRAEDFINMFYAQLRAQNFAVVLQYSP